MNFVLTIFAFIVLLGLLVFIHELGHFLAAKFTKVPVYEFAIGFGPKVFEKKIRETTYKLNILPFGGYVSLEGENESASANGFRNRNFPVKLFILSGGVLMNFLLAIVLLTIFLSSNGYFIVLPNLATHKFLNTNKVFDGYSLVFFGDEGTDFPIENNEVIVEVDGKKFESVNDFYDLAIPNKDNELKVTVLNLENLEESNKTLELPEKFQGKGYLLEITDVIEGGRSEGVFDEGDKILSVNGEYLDNPSDFSQILKAQEGKVTDFEVVKADGSLKKVSHKVGSPDEAGAILDIRYSPIWKFELVSFSEVEGTNTYFIQYKKNIFSGGALTADLSIYQYKVLFSIIGKAFSTGNFSEVSKTVGGPIAVGDAVGEVVVSRSLSSFVFLTALISLSLAIFNILPIPALDGGQIAIALIESIRRKKFSDDTVNRINFAGFAFLMILSVLILFKDIFQFNILNSMGEIIKKVFGK